VRAAEVHVFDQNEEVAPLVSVSGNGMVHCKLLGALIAVLLKAADTKAAQRSELRRLVYRSCEVRLMSTVCQSVCPRHSKWHLIFALGLNLCPCRFLSRYLQIDAPNLHCFCKQSYQQP